MKNFLLRLILMACAFYFIFPMIPGIEFHGSFWHALGAGVLFSFLGWLVELIAIMLSAVLTISTLGMALLLLIPAWLLGFWLLPALVLRYVANIMPHDLTFSGWLPAIWGGLIMLVIGIATGGKARKKVRKN